MSNPSTDELARLCAELLNSEFDPTELERALTRLCEHAAQCQERLADLTAALRENAARARALEAQIQSGARGA